MVLPRNQECRRLKLQITGGDDCISKLGDSVLGHVLSFLPAQEAARAAVLSSRWRDTYAAVHTVSLVERESPILTYDSSGRLRATEDPNPPPPFTDTVTAALLAHHRHRAGSGGGALPLRALRVHKYNYCLDDSRTVDQWLSYALKQADTDLQLDLRLYSTGLCGYSLRRAVSSEEEDGVEESKISECNDSLLAHSIGEHGDNTDEDVSSAAATSESEECSEYDEDNSLREQDGADVIAEAISSAWEHADDAVSSKDDETTSLPEPEYTVPSGLFSCDVLRMLRIGPCRLSPPSAISLPSLQELLLVYVSDEMEEVQRLVSACPRLADLTLEACHTVTVLSTTHLRRLALRCCHNLTSVAIDASELRAFEYHGAIPNTSFLTMPGSDDSRPMSIVSCNVDICSEEVTSEEELTRLREFLQLFVGTKHLHLQSARLGSGIDKATFISLPVFSSLRHLKMSGCLPHNDDAIVATMSRILQHAPNLEVLTLVFQTEPPPPRWDGWLPGRHLGCKEQELHDVHHLEHYNPYEVLDAPSAMIPCLADQVREINLVHYHGGTAQRTLAKFLLCNAPLLDELYCGFVPGPLRIQTELRQEIEGWAMNKPENRIFY